MPKLTKENLTRCYTQSLAFGVVRQSKARKYNIHLFQWKSGQQVVVAKPFDVWSTHPFKTLGRLTERVASTEECDRTVSRLAR